MRRLILLLPLLAGCPDPTINAFNTAPEATITQPTDGAVIEQNSVAFAGTVFDVQDAPPDLTVRWTTNRQPETALSEAPADAGGFLQFTATGLAQGEHVITLETADTRGESDQHSITITILADPPQVQIQEPLTGALYYASEPIGFRGQVSNADQTEYDLGVAWTSSIDGELFVGDADSTGLTAFSRNLTAGVHTITLTAVDTTGATGSAGKVVEVSAFPVGQLDQDEDGWCPDGQDVDGDGECGDGELIGPAGSNDCDDFEPRAYPGAAEVCDGIADNNCDQIDDPTDVDQDGDHWSPCQGDCADVGSVDYPNPGAVYPGATEACTGYDDDCDALLLPTEVDADEDTYMVCEGDCDDANPGVHPGGTDTPDDGLDQDCSGADTVSCHPDNDGDNYGSDAVLLSTDGDCTDPGEAASGGDCDDANAAVHPGQVEICNDWDDDCDGIWNENADPTELGETTTAIPQGFTQQILLASWTQTIAIPVISPCNTTVCTTGPNGTIQLCRNQSSVSGAFASNHDAFDAYAIEYASTLGSLTGCPFAATLTVPPGHDYGLFVYKTDDRGSDPTGWDLVASSDTPGNATESITFNDFDFGTLFGDAWFIVVVTSNGYQACPSAGAYNLTMSGF